MIVSRFISTNFSRSVSDLAFLHSSQQPRLSVSCGRCPAATANVSKNHHIFSSIFDGKRSFSQQQLSQSQSSAFARFFSHVETNKALDDFVTVMPTPISLQHLTNFGSRDDEKKQTQAINFLKDELLVRFSHIIKELGDLPCNLPEMPSAKKIARLFEDSFLELLSFSKKEASDSDYYQVFGAMLKRILLKNSQVVMMMGKAVIELKKQSHENLDLIQSFLDRFYLHRISIRMQMEQYLELFEGESSTSSSSSGSGSGSSNESGTGTTITSAAPTSVVSQTVTGGGGGECNSESEREKCFSKRIGVIDKAFDVKSVVESASRHASYLCSNFYSESPPVKVIVPNCEKVTFTYPSAHMYYILFELLKNSMRAVVERCQANPSKFGGVDSHPILVVIAKGEEDLTIKVSDEGGGIPLSGMPQLFTYLYTTAKEPVTLEDHESTATNYLGDDIAGAPLAGFGYGLPLSRLYARYFGGDLQVISVEGYGTDAYVYLKTRMDQAIEVLPYYVPQSIDYDHKVYQSPWTSKLTSFASNLLIPKGATV